MCLIGKLWTFQFIQIKLILLRLHMAYAWFKRLSVPSTFYTCLAHSVHFVPFSFTILGSFDALAEEFLAIYMSPMHISYRGRGTSGFTIDNLCRHVRCTRADFIIVSWLWLVIVLSQHDATLLRITLLFLKVCELILT